MPTNSAVDDLKPEYKFDYNKVRPNRFAKRVTQDSVIVVLDPDVAQVFTSAESVNKLLLNRVDPSREVYLAVSDKTYDEIFNEPIGEVVISDLPLKLIVIDLEHMEVKQWIPSRIIERL